MDELEELPENKILPRLRKQVKAEGGAVKWSKKHGFAVSYIYDVLGKKKPASDRVLQAMKVKREIRYYVVKE